MPLTPFHFGPAVAIKATVPNYFSLSVFAISQLIIDLEPLYYMLTDDNNLHQVFHSYSGALTIAMVCILLGKPICQLWLRIWNKLFTPGPHSRRYVEPNISWISAINGAIFGALSHIFFDSIMHSDMLPLTPWSDTNHLYGLVNLLSLHFALIVVGTLGLFWLLLQILMNRFR